MAKDILLDDDNDLLIENGDFVIGESEKQEIMLIMQAVKNDFKQFPEIGANLVESLSKTGNTAYLSQEIKLNLAMDGKTENFKIKGGQIEFYD